MDGSNRARAGAPGQGGSGGEASDRSATRNGRWPRRDSPAGGAEASAANKDDVALFVDALTRSQGRLFAFILTMLPDHAVASDILQNTNMVLWQKAGQFQLGSDFAAWSSAVAYYEVLAYRKRAARDRHLFSDVLLEQIAESASDATSMSEHMARKLTDCLQKLSRPQRKMIQERYAPGGCVAVMARESGKSEGTISQALYRIRKQLARCLRTGQAMDGGGR